MKEKCDFCENEAAHFYVMGAKRCDACAKEFDEKNRAERIAKENAKHICEDCGATFTGVYACPHCCDHEFDADEGFHCLNCGKDGHEEVLSKMYDDAKDVMKYGGL